MMKLKREPLSSETRASRRGSGPMLATICSWAAPGGTVISVPVWRWTSLENLGQAGVFGDDAQASIVVIGRSILETGLAGRRGVGNVIEVGLERGLLLVGHQLDDDRLAIGKNLVVLRAVQIDDHAGGGRILTESGHAITFYFALIEQFGAQIAGRLGIGKIKDQSIGVSDGLAAQGPRAGWLTISTADAVGGAGDLHALSRRQRFGGGCGRGLGRRPRRS